jgi:alpha-glucosidase
LLELRVVIPDEDGEYTSCLHEDDGVSDAFTTGAYLRSTFTLSRQGDRVRLSSTVKGSGYPEFRRRYFRLVFLGCRVEKLDLQGAQVSISNGHVEFQNRGEAFELSCAISR